LYDVLRFKGFVAGAAFGVEKLQEFLQGFGVGGVTEESAFAFDENEVFVLQFVQMMGERGIGNVQLFLNVSHDETLGMSGEQELHDAKARLRAHGGKHVGQFGDVLGGRLWGSGRHISILAEIWIRVKGKDGQE
jgi:hypothetical protein